MPRVTMLTEKKTIKIRKKEMMAFIHDSRIRIIENYTKFIWIFMVNWVNAPKTLPRIGIIMSEISLVIDIHMYC